MGNGSNLRNRGDNIHPIPILEKKLSQSNGRELSLVTFTTIMMFISIHVSGIGGARILLIGRWHAHDAVHEDSKDNKELIHYKNHSNNLITF